jgi:hypothetical protein
MQSPPLPRMPTQMLHFLEILEIFFFGIQDFKTVKWHFFIYYNEIIKRGENKISFLYNRSMTAEIPEFIKELI